MGNSQTNSSKNKENAQSKPQHKHKDEALRGDEVGLDRGAGVGDSGNPYLYTHNNNAGKQI